MKTENTKIVVSREKLVEKIAMGWADAEERGFHVYADEHGASLHDDSGWDLFEEGPDDDTLIRTPYLAGELSWEELIAIASHQIDLLYGFRGVAQTWHINADGDLQLNLDEYGEEE